MLVLRPRDGRSQEDSLHDNIPSACVNEPLSCWKVTERWDMLSEPVIMDETMSREKEWAEGSRLL